MALQDLAVQPVQAGVVDVEQVERRVAPPPRRSRPVPRTSAKSRTRLSSRLATRGVPRERSAIARAPAASISTPSTPRRARDDLARGRPGRSGRAGAGCRSGRAAAWSAGPARVVAPISVNGGRSSVTTRAPAPCADGDRQLAVLHRGIERLLHARAGAGGSRRRRRRARLERRSGRPRCRPCARAPGRPSARSATPSSAATICASEVLPSPGGPASSTWSSASPRAVAARDRDRELVLDAPPGRRTPRAGAGAARASSSSSGRSCGVWMRSSAIDAGRADRLRSPARPCSACGDQVLGRARPARRRAACRPPAARSRGRRGPSRASVRGSSSTARP